ncbi:transporter [Streptomyces albidoflavus]|uniref:rhodanese-like domain-containing protein n=1 Tax=Streptomyces albidoflavus TaxID=1886 RepID=UPI000BAE2D83|nr:rhodanese-like domain-containing protein [Streptomyces albidoflavus]PAX83215.1 transporter [Streptomyces albidoflavus]PAX90220.1 transporter [Streptomyces albidoflavus]PBO15003.1 transporter [Streptomyces albidoflavus]PBO21799.1 transporter [Streptomyces albidoflavus]PBO28868.1 transporter [Streptomyces albidoflavus]
MTTPTALGIGEARTRLHELTVIDVRTPGEYAAGHLPGALNIPLDHIQRALPDIRDAAHRKDVLVVCASGARSENACKILAENDITTATLSGGTGAWAAGGHELHRPRGSARTVWGMERQVRLTAGALVLLGLLLGVLIHPAFQILSAGIAGGLVFSALTNTCGMAAILAKLPYNRPRAQDLDRTLVELRSR